MRFCDMQEKRVSKGLKGKRQVGSGATPFLKGDVVLDDLLVECKTKDSVSKSITVKKEWITKAKEEAFSMNKEGAIVIISFGDGVDYVIDDYDMFKSHYEAHRGVSAIKGILDIPYEDKSAEELLDRLKRIREEIGKCI